MSTVTWYMYVLHCHYKSYYCGITTNPARRVKEHNNDKKKASKYAWSRRPVVLFYKEKHSSRSEAQKAEHAFKKLNKAQKLDYMFKRCEENTRKALASK